MIAVYVDGESHFIRTQACFRKLQSNPTASLSQATEARGSVVSLPFPTVGPSLLVADPRIKFFWDRKTLLVVNDLLRFQISDSIPAPNLVYFTCCSGSEDDLHRFRVWIRERGFEPQVIHERTDLTRQRANQLEQQRVIYKPKGVDIALASRMLEDAYRNIYEECLLFTSDVDFLPVIEAVQRVGKRVHVCGYRDGLGKRSPLEYVPYAFVDLERRVQLYELNPTP